MAGNSHETLWQLLARDPRRLEARPRQFHDADAFLRHLELYGRDEPPDGTQRLADWVRHLRGASQDDGPLVEILLDRADRILAADGGRKCTRAPTDAEVDLLLGGDDLKGAA